MLGLDMNSEERIKESEVLELKKSVKKRLIGGQKSGQKNGQKSGQKNGRKLMKTNARS